MTFGNSAQRDAVDENASGGGFVKAGDPLLSFCVGVLESVFRPVAGS